MLQNAPIIAKAVSTMAGVVNRDAPKLAHGPAKAHDEESEAVAGLVRAIDRLEETIGQETAALRTRAPIDFKEFNNRKNQGLLELTRSMRHLDGHNPGARIAERLTALRSMLETNRTVIQMHVDAVREVSTIVADAIREADSDGTYSVSIGKGAQRP
jgi:hypothetical protein